MLMKNSTAFPELGLRHQPYSARCSRRSTSGSRRRSRLHRRQCRRAPADRRMKNSPRMRRGAPWSCWTKPHSRRDAHLRRGPPPPRCTSASRRDLMRLMYTSGTTRPPQGRCSLRESVLEVGRPDHRARTERRDRDCWWSARSTTSARSTCLASRCSGMAASSRIQRNFEPGDGACGDRRGQAQRRMVRACR